MAGNRRWFIYESDASERFLVELDEEVGDNLGFDRLAYDSPVIPMLPSGFRMRVVNTKTQDEKRRRAYPVGKRTHAAFTGQTKEIRHLGTFWYITGVRGERIRRAYAEP